eukprot:6214543-Pleurochrysis_carterae.AAC.1
MICYVKRQRPTYMNAQLERWWRDQGSNASRKKQMRCDDESNVSPRPARHDDRHWLRIHSRMRMNMMLPGDAGAILDQQLRPAPANPGKSARCRACAHPSNVPIKQVGRRRARDRRRRQDPDGLPGEGARIASVSSASHAWQA